MSHKEYALSRNPNLTCRKIDKLYAIFDGSTHVIEGEYSARIAWRAINRKMDETVVKITMGREHCEIDLAKPLSAEHRDALTRFFKAAEEEEQRRAQENINGPI